MTLLEDQNNDTWIEEIRKKDYEILNLKTELQNAMAFANQQRDEIASLEETIDKYHRLGEKQQEEIEELKAKVNINKFRDENIPELSKLLNEKTRENDHLRVSLERICAALEISCTSSLEDVEDLVNTNGNLKTEIQKQQEEIEELKTHFYQVCQALGIDPSDIDDIENAIDTNENLEAEIKELKDSEVPECVFDTMRWMALKLDLNSGVVGIPASVARGLYKISTRLGRDERRFDEETILNGLRWLQDNFDR